MALPIATLAKARLVVGRDFVTGWIIDPDPSIPATTADVIADLGGATATASIVDTDAAMTVIVAAGSITTSIDAADRTIVATIAAAATAALVPGIYRWAVYVTLAGGEKYPIATGPVNVCAL